MASSFNQPIRTRSVIAAKASKSIPAGTIMELSWSQPLPLDWMECDGRMVSKSLYKELFDAIGTTYGVNNNLFTIPDLQGKARLDCACGHNASAHQMMCLVCPVEDQHRMRMCLGYQPDNLLWLLENKDKHRANMS